MQLIGLFSGMYGLRLVGVFSKADVQYPMVLFLVVILLLTTWESCLSLHGTLPARHSWMEFAEQLESVTALPGLGLQLSTTTTCHPPLLARPLFSLSSSKTFIPLSDISSVVIHEGLTRLSVRYYLAIIKRNGHSIQVAFPVSPPLPLAI